MSISILVLAVLLILLGLTWTGLVAVPLLILGIFAIVDGILFLLEGVGVYNFTLPGRRV